MHWRKTLGMLAVVAAISISRPSLADSAKDYQVTGEVLSVEKNMVVVQKNDEKWEISIDDTTKIDGKLKVGEKVTIHYHMVADKVVKKDTDDKKDK